MRQTNGPVIDMTPDGAFVVPPKPSLGTILLRLAAFGIFLAIGAVVFWTAVIVLPVLLLLGVAGYLVARTQMRRL